MANLLHKLQKRTTLYQSVYIKSLSVTMLRWIINTSRQAPGTLVAVCPSPVRLHASSWIRLSDSSSFPLSVFEDAMPCVYWDSNSCLILWCFYFACKIQPTYCILSDVVCHFSTPHVLGPKRTVCRDNKEGERIFNMMVLKKITGIKFGCGLC